MLDRVRCAPPFCIMLSLMPTVLKPARSTDRQKHNLGDAQAPDFPSSAAARNWISLIFAFASACENFPRTLEHRLGHVQCPLHGPLNLFAGADLQLRIHFVGIGDEFGIA